MSMRASKGRFVALSLALTIGSGAASAQASAVGAVERKRAVLLDDFISALEQYSGSKPKSETTRGERYWLDGLAEHGVDADFLARRLAKAKARAKQKGISSSSIQSSDPFAAYRYIDVETLPKAALRSQGEIPVALHAFRLDVIEDYDDVMNDDVYAYFITTHDDILWGRVTSIYRGMDEGTSVFFTPQDRALFGPDGEKLAPRNHTLVDYGLVESDGEDVAHLQRLTDAIVDLALVAVTIYNPQAGAAAAQAREETKNLLRLVVELDDDDRLVADTLRFTPQAMTSLLSGGDIHEFSREHDRETTFTHFTYRLHFRLFK